MISVEDCIAMCELTREEIAAIAEHEHLSEVGAAAFAEYMMHAPKGAEAVRAMIVEDIRAAMERKDRDHARDLLHALRHFEKAHPESAPTVV